MKEYPPFSMAIFHSSCTVVIYVYHVLPLIIRNTGKCTQIFVDQFECLNPEIADRRNYLTIGCKER